jgi:predicted AlkP superfamily pyrophosphatase or phosphodiesterase
MLPMPRPLFPALLTLSLLAGCNTTTAPRDAVPAPVVLISLDGFRAGDLDRGLTPNLARIEREGVRAAWMTPSYPSLTFPNHYTVVTGLRPDRHGIVQNTMRDEALGTFKLGDSKAVSDGRWWGGEPIWVGAERAGLPTAAMFWPGTEAAIDGVRPTRWHPYDGDVPNEERVDRVLGWLAEDASTRPRFSTLYFDKLDKASHEHGPDSPEAREAIAALDHMIGRLVDGLEARGQLDAVNLVVVSDHGMAPVLPGQMVAVEDMVDPDDVDVVTSGQSVGFEPKPGRTAAAEAQLLGRHERYECWRKGELPARWHYGRHPRVPAIVCQMDDGWDARWRESIAKRPAKGTRGSHGFDPQLPSMRAIFLARGPGFRDGVRVPAIENVDVYPVLAKLVGIEPAPNDGDARALEAALEDAR